jgi:hypothetical protein
MLIVISAYADDDEKRCRHPLRRKRLKIKNGYVAIGCRNLTVNIDNL